MKRMHANPPLSLHSQTSSSCLVDRSRPGPETEMFRDRGLILCLIFMKRVGLGQE